MRPRAARQAPSSSIKWTLAMDSVLAGASLQPIGQTSNMAVETVAYVRVCKGRSRPHDGQHGRAAAFLRPGGWPGHLAPTLAGAALRYWKPAFASRIARPLAVLSTALMWLAFLPLLALEWRAMLELVGNHTLV